MKVFIAVVLIVLVMIFLGWLRFSSSDNTASIHLDTNEVQEDTAEAVDAGRRTADQAADETREFFNEDEDETPAADDDVEDNDIDVEVNEVERPAENAEAVEQ